MTNCITTASGIVTLCKQPYSMQVESGLRGFRSPPAYCTAAYRGWRYQRMWWYNLSSWGWAACWSKHVEDLSVTYVGRLISFASTVIFLFILDVSGWNRFCVVAWYLSSILLHLEHTDAYSPHQCTSKWKSFQTFGSNSVLLLNS